MQTDKSTPKTKGILSVVSAIWFIIVLLPNGGNNDTTILVENENIMENTIEETPTVQNSKEMEDVQGSNLIESGTYEVDGIRVTYYSNVWNDVTGNWRLGVVYDSSDLNSYVVDYYNFFCRMIPKYMEL